MNRDEIFKEAKETGKNYQVFSDGSFIEIPNSAKGCTVYWTDCNPPHSTYSYILQEGQSMAYHDWDGSRCVFKTFDC